MDINYINSLLKEGLTVKEVRNRLNLSEKVFQRNIKKLGYKYNQKLRKYIECDAGNTVVTEKQKYKSNTLVTPNTKDINKDINLDKFNKNNALSVPIDYKQDLIELIEAKEQIFNMLKDYNNKCDNSNTPIIEVVQDQGIKIKQFEGNIKHTSFKLNEGVLENWRSFCNENKEFNRQDLLNMALTEYMEKYK